MILIGGVNIIYSNLVIMRSMVGLIFKIKVIYVSVEFSSYFLIFCVIYNWIY